MKISRRDSLKSAALAAGGAALGLPFASTALAAAQSPAGAPGQSGPKRFVFFLFSNGFEPGHVRPKDLAGASRSDKLVDVDLAPHKLPGHSEPMEKYKDRMTILQGVNGQHCHTSHGSPFGCLAGVRKGSTPKANEDRVFFAGKRKREQWRQRPWTFDKPTLPIRPIYAANGPG